MTDLDRARAWLNQQPQEPDDLPSLASLLAEVRREAIEECAYIAEGCSAATNEREVIAARIREHARIRAAEGETK